MRLPQLSVLSALLVLLLAAGRCTAAALLRGSGTRGDGRSIMELSGRYHRTRPVAEVGRQGVDSSEKDKIPLRDPHHKEKFIILLTGPLYINPKCKKHFNRLYYNTRDCTVPAYYKRCARLLTRLANSPRCSER